MILLFILTLIGYFAQNLPLRKSVITYNWKITFIKIAGDGYARKAIGINHRPAQEFNIDVNVGDFVEVNVHNELDIPSTLHFHGILQDGTTESDGTPGITQCPIPPGKSFTYKWIASNSGTYWWYGSHESQYLDGLKGPIIIRGIPEIHASLYDKESTVQLTDWFHQNGSVLSSLYFNPLHNPHGSDPVWSSGLINGYGRYNCDAIIGKKPVHCDSSHKLTTFKIIPGIRYRLRLINMGGFAAFRISIDGHQMTVIEVDGVSVHPITVNRLKIDVGQRYSVIVVANQPNALYLFRATLISKSPRNFVPLSRHDPGMYPQTIALWSYPIIESFLPRLSKSIPWTENTFVDLNEMDLSPVIPMNAPSIVAVSLDFSFSFRRTAINPQKLAYFSLDFGKSESTFRLSRMPILNSIFQGDLWRNSLNVVEIFQNQGIQIVIWNNDDKEYPFNLHGHSLFLIAKGTLPKGSVTIPSNLKILNPLRRDVITVPGCTATENGCIDVGYAVVRFRADNPGVWLFNCHLPFHLKAGLGMVFVESADIIRQRKANGRMREMNELCSSFNQGYQGF